MSEERKDELSEITEMGAARIQNKNGNICVLTVIGQVEGHELLPPQSKSTKYEHLIPRLVSCEEDEGTDGLLLILNTIGGDVEAGLALAEMVAGMKKPTVSLVLGGGHSIGVPLAVAAKTSFIAPTAAMTLHPVRMNRLMLGVPQAVDYLTRMQDRIIDFIVAHSHIEASALRKLMMNTSELATDIGTMLFGKGAVENGLIDRVGGIRDAMDELYRQIKITKDKDE